MDSFQYSIERASQPTPSVQINQDLGDRLRLLGYDLDTLPSPLGENRYRIVYYWQVLEGFDRPFAFRYGINPEDDVQQLSTDYVFVDVFTSTSGEPFRVVHLPTYVLLPSSEWRAGDLLREAYDYALPADLGPGVVEWKIGLYIVPQYFSIRTTPDRLVPGTEDFVLGDIELNGGAP